MPKDWKFTLTKGNAGAGRELFVELECFKCHEMRGEKFPDVAEGDKGLGPELTQVAGSHPVEFLVESIAHPNAVIDEAGIKGESTVVAAGHFGSRYKPPPISFDLPQCIRACCARVEAEYFYPVNFISAPDQRRFSIGA